MSKILYIEDNAHSRQLVQRVLEGVGHEVVLAPDGLAGIEAARREVPELILMDINMPDLSGDMVATRLRTTPGVEQIPIVALTALSDYRERALVAGCVGYITKPIDIDALPVRVSEYLAGRRDMVEEEDAGRVFAEYSQALVRRLEIKVRELEEANRELRRMDKIKSDFISLASHEMRTPFTLVYGYVHLLQEIVDPARDPEAMSMVNNLVSAAHRLGEVIDEILDLARIASGQIALSLSPVNLLSLAEEAAGGVRQAAEGRRVNIQVVDGGWPEILADPVELALALENIMGNAVKYTPDGGGITVSARCYDDTFVEVAIADTGIGIDPEEQGTIFEVFYTAGDTDFHTTSKTAFKGGGLGLGLAIAKSVIDAHKGRIWAESPGRDERMCPGSTFHILLPIDPEKVGSI
jgi:signal transduction histidine kinase